MSFLLHIYDYVINFLLGAYYFTIDLLDILKKDLVNTSSY